MMQVVLQLKLFHYQRLSQLIKDTDMVISSNGPEDRQIKMTGFPVKLSETPSQLYRPPPLLGEHTEEVLKKIKK